MQADTALLLLLPPPPPLPPPYLGVDCTRTDVEVKDRLAVDERVARDLVLGDELTRVD
jgi:hypothetical protein